jgi:hypothetical protein
MRVPALLGATFAWLGRPAPRYWLAGAGMLVTSAVGVVIYAGYVDPIYPIRDWLAWPMLALWGYVALCNLAWLAAGNFIVGRLLGLRELPILEGVVISAAAGVVVFTELMYVAGVLRLYGPTFALLLPSALIALGLPELLALLRRYRETSSFSPAASPRVLLLWATGGALTFIVYLGVLSPDAVNYDAAWCHLTIAQDYAREGRIVPFPGDYSKNVPQLASLIHTWGFSVPGLQPALRWMLALHQEFALFLWTLAGVAAATRRMLGDERVQGTWAVFYSFPIIFVYDHNLGGAADHVAAFFALPGLLSASRLLEGLTWQRAAAMVLCMAGGMLTKYQAYYWVLPLLLVAGVKLSRSAFAHFRQPGTPENRRQLMGVALTIGLGLPLLVSPHFLKNWLFYADPVYPFMQSFFAGAHPSVAGGDFLFNNVFTDLNWVPKGNVGAKLSHALELAFTFSFVPHYSFTKNFPAFGSLFTLLLPALLFIRRRRAKLLGVFVGMTTLVIWGYTFNVDRNLQVFMPILVATTAAVLVEIWRLGWLSRIALAPLVTFQLLWGGDAIFYSSQERIRAALDLIGTGYAGRANKRFEHYRSAFLAIGRALPPDAVVMLHTSHVSLGIDRRLVLDWAGFQGLLSYAEVHNPEELLRMYRGVGLTHVLYSPGERVASTIQEEVVFQALVRQLDPPISTAGGFRLLRLPRQVAAANHPYRVLALGLYGYGSGVFPVDRLFTNEYVAPAKRRYASPSAPAPTSAAELQALDVDAVVVGASASLNQAQTNFLRRGFSSIIQYPGQQTIYLPKTQEAGPP